MRVTASNISSLDHYVTLNLVIPMCIISKTLRLPYFPKLVLTGSKILFLASFSGSNNCLEISSPQNLASGMLGCLRIKS